MPKKFQGENSKASAAKAKKAEKAAADKAMKDKAAEDAYWKDDDKLITKKLKRKESKEQKKMDDSVKRQERRELEEQEIKEMQARVPAPPLKITVFQLEKQKEEKIHLQSVAKEKDDVVSHLDAPLVENLNRSNTEIIAATGIDAAVAALSVSDSPAEKHPEKRMATAYRAFEADRLPHLKKDNPTMRHSQLKQLLRKEWQKSPQNPLNQVSS